MKLIKINTDHYGIVDDSEIKEGEKKNNMRYKLISNTTSEEHLCEKVTIDGFDYYVSDEEIKTQDKFYSYLIFEDEEGEETQSFGIYTCLLNSKNKYENHITSIETGRNGDNTKHFIFETDTCKLVIATNNLNINDIPKVVDKVEKMAHEYAKNEYPSSMYSVEIGMPHRGTAFRGFTAGYNKSQETHPFSEEDMIEFAWFMYKNLGKFSNDYKAHLDGEYLKLWKEQQPKIVYYE